MAKGNPAPDEGADDAALVAAIADTEGEIFNEAMGDPDPDNDGDRSLEEMEDPVGEDPEEIEASEEEDDGESEEPESEEDEGEEEPQRDERQEARVPSFRLREERERADRLERELAELRGTVNAIRQQPTPQQQQRPEKPDPFADPEGHERWVTENAIREVQQRNFNAAMAEGLEEHGEEFRFAHDELAKLGPNNPEGVQVFQRMIASRDPVKVLMRWAEPRLQEFREQRDQEFQEQIAERYGVDPDTFNRALAIASKASGTRPQQQQRMGRLPPSLNSAGGSGRTAARDRVDPRGMDGSEAAIFADAFTPLR